MEFFQSLLQQLFQKEQCSGVTMGVTISMVSEAECSKIVRISTCGGDTTTIQFKPPLITRRSFTEGQSIYFRGELCVVLDRKSYNTKTTLPYQ